MYWKETIAGLITQITGASLINILIWWNNKIKKSKKYGNFWALIRLLVGSYSCT